MEASWKVHVSSPSPSDTGRRLTKDDRGPRLAASHLDERRLLLQRDQMAAEASWREQKMTMLTADAELMSELRYTEGPYKFSCHERLGRDESFKGGVPCPAVPVVDRSTRGWERHQHECTRRARSFYKSSPVAIPFAPCTVSENARDSARAIRTARLKLGLLDSHVPREPGRVPAARAPSDQRGL
eukprot:gnl/TRDRNA2_/TRDRNA2_190935_c0_seq1.p1 gnl/TRDRNA2_/TRDRNA2_190935_c0~~gnl/TRDRNA2_/TRDRNA2_190935_c0_seq1.p1  ORF type:complete len:185 (-),score=19.75 gnl/TRDRNA2_/TRDRNA2_190935_c0_seq1:20-574(-)